MNIHPMIVHFPVALLTVYSLMELVRFRKINSNDVWFYIKSFVIVVGTLGSYAAFMAGDPAAHIYRQAHPEMRSILGLHETWAGITVTIFSIIAVIYLVQVLRKAGYVEKIKNIPIIGSVWNIVSAISDFMFKPSIMVTLALAGLLSVTLTGAFGGTLVYGSTSDPFISLVNKIFIGK